MAAVVCLDTHAVVALFDGDVRKLGREAARLLARHPALITPAVLLELQLLHEIGRLNRGAMQVYAKVERELGLAVDEQPWERLTPQILAQSWTRDPFDRAIAGHAALLKAPLLSKDSTIQAHYSRACW